MLRKWLTVVALCAALIVEFSAVEALLASHAGDRALLWFLLQHALASVVLTGVGWFLVPSGYRQPRWAVLASLFNFSFFMSALGLLGLYVAVRIATYRRRSVVYHPFEKKAVPEFVLSLREPDMKFSQGQIKSRLAQSAIPVPQRLQSLLALQGIPARVSSPLLQDMLDDSADDIRLVAYGLLDSREKKITAQIHDELSKLRSAKKGRVDLVAIKQLAELYWEMVYAGLAKGDLRTHSLNQSLSYADDALKHVPKDTGMLLLKGRVLHELKRNDEAREIFDMAIKLGLPESRALPYLVEIAFEQGEYAEVRSLLSRISSGPVSPLMQKSLEFWVPAATSAALPVSGEFAL